LNHTKDGFLTAAPIFSVVLKNQYNFCIGIQAIHTLATAEFLPMRKPRQSNKSNFNLSLLQTLTQNLFEKFCAFISHNTRHLFVFAFATVK